MKEFFYASGHICMLLVWSERGGVFKHVYKAQASKLSTYDFSTLYTTLPHHLIKDKLIDLINRTFIRENTQYLACTKTVLFSLLMYIIITIYGRVKKSVMPLFIFWIIFLLDLELNFIGKLLVFRWELIVLLLLQICFFFVMREIS